MKIAAIYKHLKWLGLYFLCTVLVIILALKVQQQWYGHEYQALRKTALSNAAKIIINNPDYVYDLSGSESFGEGNSMNLFDENCDPKNNSNILPITHPLPVKAQQIYFPKGRGLRIVVDLQARHQLTELYWYDRSLQKDTVWLFTGTPKQWQQKLQYITQGTAQGWGWKSMVIKDTSRFLQIQFNHPGAILTSLVVYGKPLEKRSTTLSGANTTVTTIPKTLREFAGTNSYDCVQPTLLQPFRFTRLYQQLRWYDADTVHNYPNNEISLNIFNVPTQQQLRNWGDSLKKLNNSFWISMYGIPEHLLKHGYKEKSKPVTVPGMDTENPLSYARHANVYWNLAAVFGTQKVDTTLLKVKERPRYSGLNLLRLYENGNEEDAYWTNDYWNPVEYFAVSSADYDGHEGKLGFLHGIKNADSNALLITSGMVQLDTNRIKTLKFLCEQLRNDQQFIWQGGVQYHYYCNVGIGKNGMPIAGITPEEDRLREKLARVKAFHKRILPGVPVILGENGYDRNQQSWQRTPLLPEQDAETSQAVLQIRSLMAAFFSGIDRYNQYMIRNATDNENATGAYATSGMIGGPGQQKIYKNWYYWKNFIDVLGDYMPDSIINETGDIWVYRLKKRLNSNNKAYFIIAPFLRTNITKKYILNLQNTKNQIFSELKLFQKDIEKQLLLIKNNQLEIVVGLFPMVIISEETH
jgi:hypothetical protein